MRKDLKDIRYEISEIGRLECIKLFRLARKAQDHWCSYELVKEIRLEAYNIYNTYDAYPERFLDVYYVSSFKYAFK